MVYTLYFLPPIYGKIRNGLLLGLPKSYGVYSSSPNRPLAAGTPADCKTPQARATSVNSARTSHQIDDEAKENHKFPSSMATGDPL